MSTLSGVTRAMLRELRPAKVIARYRFYQTKPGYGGTIEGPRAFWPIDQLLLRGRFGMVAVTMWWRCKSALAVLLTGEELH